ncbi:MAG: HD domain-containing protein [Candidatus Omnitrophica bacterium]|nr:HD domain-containing protein [Candidatus Omnitrophota bacterium]
MKNTEDQRAFFEAAKQWRAIFDAIPESICLIDDKLTILRCNSSMAELLGKSFKDIIGEKLDRFKTEIDLSGLVSQLIKKMSVGSGRVTEVINSKNNWYEVTLHPVIEKVEKPARSLLIIRNITHLKEMERGLTETHERLKKAFHGTVNALATTIEKRDPFTAGHERRVAQIAQALAISLDMDSERVEGILVAGLLHDVGKIVVPAEILSKPGTLNSHEYNIVKSHPAAGYEILKKVEFPWPIADIVLQHHERLNGTGYPNKLTKEKIIFEARIIAVADVVEAMLSKRPYRKAKTVNQMISELQEQKGILFDEKVVDACIRLFVENNFKLE